MPAPPDDDLGWVSVSSSWIERIHYDSITQRLFVKTKGNPEPYEHHGVPLAKWKLFRAAPSKGVFWNLHFKERYPRR